MATDFFVAKFWTPMFIITLALITAYYYLKKKGVDEEFKSLNGKKIILGFVGAVLATIIYSGISALQLGINKVGLGHITYSELSNYYLGYWIYVFVLSGSFILAGLVIIGLPAIFILSKLRYASFFGVIQLSLIIALFRGLMVVYSPYNNWCGLHPWECSMSNFLDMFIICLATGVGFGIGAKFPLWRNKIEKQT